MALGILRSMLDKRGVSNVRVISSGTGTLDGYPASTNSIQAAKAHGIDISDHHAQMLTPELVKQSDLILTLAYGHYAQIAQEYPEAIDKLFMVKSFPDDEPSQELSVRDPIGLDYDDYLRTFNELKRELRRALPAIIERINEKID
jgi:protein-tyrosine phosphatase